MENNSKLQPQLRLGKIIAAGLGLSIVLTIASIFSPLSYIWTNVLIAFVALFGAVFAPIFMKIIDIKINYINDDFPKNQIVESAKAWLESSSDIIRSEQTIDLCFESVKHNTEDMIKITAVHKYIVHNSFPDKALSVPVKIYSGLGRGKSAEGGFEYVKINDTEFSGDLLRVHIATNEEQTIKHFIYNLSIPIGGSASFEYHSYGIYRLEDRLIWTFQRMSDNIRLSVKNDTNFKDKLFKYKINHHDCEAIENGRINRSSQQNRDTINFDDYIFPYQGFEISWDFKAKTGK